LLAPPPIVAWLIVWCQIKWTFSVINERHS